MYRILCLIIAIPLNCYSQVFYPYSQCQQCVRCGGCWYNNYPSPSYPSNYPPLYPWIHNRPTLRPNIVPSYTTPSKVIVNTGVTAEENVITTPTTPVQETIPTPTTTPCPAVTAPPNRCPAIGNHTYNDCQNYKRFFPNPIGCSASSDCPEPFNTCCEDSCFGMKICKTYLKNFEN